MTTLQETSSAEAPFTDQFILPVDAEHAGLRMTGCLSFMVAVVAIFSVVTAILPNAIILNLLIALGGGAALAYVLEQILRRQWPSGRRLVADSEMIALYNKDRIEAKIDPQAYTNVLAWHFEVKRNSRVRKGWYVIGFALEQDGEYIPLYTFAPPETFDNMRLASYFRRLTDPKKQKEDSQSIRLAGEQRRLYEAEHIRGLDGAEVTFEQFETYLDYLQNTFPKWMITAS